MISHYPIDHPRRSFLESKLIQARKYHPVAYEANAEFFKWRNSLGHQHDLGAQDAFIDDAGILFAEQIPDEYQGLFDRQMRHRLGVWDALKVLPVQKMPWYGRYFNAARKTRQGGDPVGQLRLYRDALFTKNDEWLGSETTLSKGPTWSFLNLFPDFQGSTLGERIDDKERGTMPHGLVLPPGAPTEVPHDEILPAWQATPDLPPNVNVICDHDRSYDEDTAILANLVVDQGETPTCAAHAVATAVSLSIARHVGFDLRMRFCPWWLHMASGDRGDDGRTFDAIIAVLEQGLPISAKGSNFTSEIAIRQTQRLSLTDEIREQREKLTRQHGHITVRQLDPQRIDEMKTYLAAGWVVIIGTHLTELFNSTFFYETGMALRPPKGMARNREDGHAWVLAGYRHVDSHEKTRYQGRFTALTSWGKGFGTAAHFGPGTVSLPFGFVYSEAFSAHAIRIVT